MPECFTCGCGLRAGEGRRRKVLTGSRESRSSPSFLFGKGQYRSHSSNTYGVRTVCIRCSEIIDKQQSTGTGWFSLIGLGVLGTVGLIVLLARVISSPSNTLTEIGDRNVRGAAPIPAKPLQAPAKSPPTAPRPEPSAVIDSLSSPPISNRTIPSVVPSAAVPESSTRQSQKPTLPEPSSSKRLHHDAEKIAANRVYLAHNALENGGIEIARKHLKEVLDKYPSTKAAIGARAMLEKLPPEPAKK